MSAVKDKILTIEDVAKLKGVGVESIRNAIRKGKLKATFFHGAWHIRESNYLKYKNYYQQGLQSKRLVTLAHASVLLKISQSIILRAIQKGKIETCGDKQGLKIPLDSLLEWERTWPGET